MKLISTFTIWLLLIVSNVWAQDDCIPIKPSNQTGLVYQYHEILSPQEVQLLEDKIQSYDKESSIQILIIVVDDLCGYDRAMFTYEIGERWEIGDDKFDNGMVIMVQPTGGSGQRDAFIATGYGLEEFVPDAIAKRIIEQTMIPNFRNGNYFEGLDQSVNIIIGLTSGQFSPQQLESDGLPLWPFLLLLLIFILVVIIISRNNRGGGRRAIDSRTLMGPYRGSGGWTDFSGGSGTFGGGFGGGSGGGFGGFGGGSFGGGGAGGSW